ncbi:Melibiose operon regulatory protein [Nitratireductor thuwali]|uniref:Melibiose operon regulatory protein n=2 Tax=Nitratireductor thuwali TaxID=2267699 RepID=A0ABY5MH90_9HYPH|nr:Melibiose operon regulatory protein [Nitratireductor thuwali]
MAVVRPEKSRNSTAGRTIELFPPGTKSDESYARVQEGVIIALHERWLQAQAEIEFGGQIEWPSRPVMIDDENAKRFASMIQEEFRSNGRLNSIYVNSLVSVFGTIAIRQIYLQGLETQSGLKGGLSFRNLRLVNEFVAENISETVTVEHLAKLVNLSQSHFMRAFRETTGQSPHQYIISQRVSYAEDLVVKTDLPLAEIARLAGFHSHSHMTATMRRLRGITPTALRREHLR